MADKAKSMTMESIKEHMAHLHTLESFSRALIEAMCVSAMAEIGSANASGSIPIKIKATVSPAPIDRGGCTQANPCMEFCVEVGGSKIYFNLGMGCKTE